MWQQLQKSSPRLNLLFEQPYMLRSPFGLRFSLEMYRRDSTFLNLNMNLGTSYRISEKQTGSVFLQRRQTIVNGVNTPAVLQTKQLPRDADVSSLNLGMSYAFNTTVYRFNPKKGSEFTITATAGTKRLKKNPQILELKDPSDPSFNFESLYDTVKLKVYQVRFTVAAAHFVPVGRQSTLKIGVNSGVYQSANYFRNEMFQIGGYKLLRGFDEESQFLSRYAIGTVEYRYLIGLNSAFFGFLDGGYGKGIGGTEPNYSYLGTGLGLSFETKAGIIHMAWAIGKRNDLEFNLRKSKVHLGFAGYF
jgi:hemolysin activation/secretion protein